TGGLGAGNYLWCLIGTLPSGFGGASTTCGTGTSTLENTFKLTANPVGAGAAGGSPYNGITAEAGDAGNAAVPDSFSSSTSSTTSATSIIINPALVASFLQGASNNPAALLQGVASRTYGVKGDPPTYSVTGGFGAGTYQWCLTGTLPGNFTGAPSSTCTLAASTKENGFSLTASPVAAGAA